MCKKMFRLWHHLEPLLHNMECNGSHMLTCQLHPPFSLWPQARKWSICQLHLVRGIVAQIPVRFWSNHPCCLVFTCIYSFSYHSKQAQWDWGNGIQQVTSTTKCQLMPGRYGKNSIWAWGHYPTWWCIILTSNLPVTTPS